MNKDTVFICPNPNCGYQGKPEIEGYGSAFLAVILFLLLVIPGILYMLFGVGTRFVCPNCKAEVGKM